MVSKQQILILMASMIYAGEELELVEAMGKFYPIFLELGHANVNTIVAKLNDEHWTRDIVLNRVQRLTEAEFLEKEHYRAWRLNVDRILALNTRS